MSRLLTIVAIILVVFSNISHSETPEHLRIQVALEKGVFRLVATTVVPGPMPQPRGLERTYPWRCLVKDNQHQVVYKVGIEDPSILRGEFQNPDDPDKIDAVHLKAPEPIHFSLRIPKLAGRWIEFQALPPNLRRSKNPPDRAYERLGVVDYPEERP